MTGDPVADAAPTSWRDLAVARSLDPARARAEKRVQRFLDAALELMARSPEKEFTVQEVVERSGQSLRSFYQYFAGKHELLLALFEEAVRSTAAQLEQVIADETDPLARLRRFTGEYYRMCRPSNAADLSGTAQSGATATVSVMADFAQQLLTQHPKEAAQAFVPLVSRYEELLDDAAAAGSIRRGLDHRRITGVVLQAVMFNSFADTISASSVRVDADVSADGLWELLLDGLGTGKRG
jgi:AcrR family transcriptional regulator